MSGGARLARAVAAALALGAAHAAAGPAAAQPGPSAPSPIAARADRTTLSTDETLRVTVEVQARSMQLSQLRQPVFDGFAIVSTGSRSELSMINGVPSMVLGYDFVLQPVRAGELVVPPFEIDVDGVTHASAPIAVTVTAGTRPTVSPNELAPGAAAPSQRFFVRAAVDRASVWLGEQLTYTFKFYQAANLGQQPAYGAPPFTGFWQRRESNQRSDRVLVGDRLFLVTELDTYLFPTRAGLLTIPPATLSLVGDLTDARNRLATEPIDVEVKPLPDGAPPEFGGAVGRYRLSAAVEPAVVAVDEPVRLTVTLAGEGNLETAPEPDWPAIDGWTAYDDGQTTSIEARGGRIAGQKQWRRLLVPARAGQFALPALRYGAFDPAAGRYDIAEARSIVVTVRDAPGGAPPAATAAPARADGAVSAPTVAAAAPDTARWAAEAPLREPALAVRAAAGRVDGRGGGARLAASTARADRPAPLGHAGWALAWLGPLAVVGADAVLRRRAAARAARRSAAGAQLAAAVAAARRQAAAARAADGGDPHGDRAAVVLAAALRAVVRAGIGPAADGLSIDALPPALAAHGVGRALVEGVVAALRAGDAATWRPAGWTEPAGAVGAARTADADADALLAALGEALARHLAAGQAAGSGSRR